MEGRVYENGKVYKTEVELSYDEEGLEICNEISREEIVEDSDSLKQEVENLKNQIKDLQKIIGVKIDE